MFLTRFRITQNDELYGKQRMSVDTNPRAMMNHSIDPEGHLAETSEKTTGTTGNGSISKKPRRSGESEVEGVLAGAPPTPATSDERKVVETKAESSSSKATPPEPSTESDTGAERTVSSPPGPEVKVPEEDADDSLERAAFTFPARLMELLEGGVEKEALWWLDGGDCFCVVPKIFAERVLNKYFQSTKFESFTRKLNRWGFKRAAGQHVPANTIAYYHSHFKRGCKDLLKNMRGTKKREHADLDVPVSHVGGGMSSLQFPSIQSAAPGGGLLRQSDLAASTHLNSLALAGGAFLPGGGMYASPDLLSSSAGVNAFLANPMSQDVHLQALLATQQSELARMHRARLLNAELAMNAQVSAELQLRHALAGSSPYMGNHPADLASILASAQFQHGNPTHPSLGRIPQQQQGRSMTSSGVDATLLQRALDRQRQLERRYE